MQTHPDAVVDHSDDKVVTRAYNNVNADGVGGKIPMRGTQLAQVKLGPIAFTDFLALITTGKSAAFEGEDTDGLIGATFLRAFDVYFDYPNARVVLALNARTKRIARPAAKR